MSMVRTQMFHTIVAVTCFHFPVIIYIILILITVNGPGSRDRISYTCTHRTAATANVRRCTSRVYTDFFFYYFILENTREESVDDCCCDDIMIIIERMTINHVVSGIRTWNINENKNNLSTSVHCMVQWNDSEKIFLRPIVVSTVHVKTTS